MLTNFYYAKNTEKDDILIKFAFHVKVLRNSVDQRTADDREWLEKNVDSTSWYQYTYYAGRITFIFKNEADAIAFALNRA